MSKLVICTADELETLIRKAVGGGKVPKKKAVEEDDEDTGFGEDDEEVEDDEVTVGMVKELLASLVKKKKDVQIQKAFAAIKCKPSVSAVPEAKLKSLYEKLKAIK